MVTENFLRPSVYRLLQPPYVPKKVVGKTAFALYSVSGLRRGIFENSLRKLDMVKNLKNCPILAAAVFQRVPFFSLQARRFLLCSLV